MFAINRANVTHFVGCVCDASLANLAAGSRIFINVFASHPGFGDIDNANKVSVACVSSNGSPNDVISIVASTIFEAVGSSTLANEPFRAPKTCKASVAVAIATSFSFFAPFAPFMFAAFSAASLGAFSFCTANAPNVF